MRTQSLLLVGTCIWATGVAAQDRVDLGVLRIESAGAQSLLGNTEITQEELEERNPQTMADIFAGETSVSASGGAAIAQKVYVNGIEESLLSVTIDGARQNKSAFHHTGNILLDPELLKSVEVSEGIAPADAGPNALAGGLAYTTKDARDLLDDGDTIGGLAALSYGSENNIRRSLTVFGQHDGFEWLLSGTRHTGDDYKDGSGDRVLGTEADLSAYVLKLAYTSQSGKRLSFASSVTEDTGTRAAQAHPFHGAITIRPDLLGLTGGVADIMIKGLSRRTSHTLTYTDENPQGWFAPTIQLSYNKQEIDSGDVEGTNTSLSGFIKNEWQLSNGTVTAGIDFFDEKAEGKGVARRTAPPPVAGTYRGEETLKSIGLFAQARQDLGDRLSVSYGARADRQILTGADGSKHEDTGLSANAQLDYMLTDTLSLNAGYASSWGGYELGEAGLINFITPWSYAGFKTSSSQSARLGLRFDNGIWAVSGALYETKIKNLTAVLPSGGARGATSDVTTRGFDASLGYTGAQGFAKLNYTYADVEQNGNVISSTAYYYGRPVGHMIGLEAGYDFNDQWRIGGNAEIALQNDKPALNMPGYEVVNVFATYEPEALDGLSLRLDVKNLFDQTYVARSADGFGNARVNTLNEPGRSISLSASMKF